MRLMGVSAEHRIIASDLPAGHTAVFQLRCGDRIVNGFVVNHDGRVHAYVNRCPHRGPTLDTWPNELLSEDRRSLICSTHGALFEPDTGRCTDGPCVGASLARLAVRREGDCLVIGCADAAGVSGWSASVR